MPYKRNGKWLGQVRINGKTCRKTFPTKKEAKEWEVEKKKTAEKQEKTETPSTCLIDWATAYLNYSQVKFVQKTLDEKTSMFRNFFKAISGELPVEELTPGIVLSYLQGQYKKRSGYAVNKERKNLVAGWNWGIKYLGLPSLNPCLVDRFPETRHVRYVPPESDFWKVYAVAECDQDKVMLLAYLHLAARKKELFNLRWADVDFNQSRVQLFTRKRKDGFLEADWLPMTDDLFNALFRHKQPSSNEWVFPDPQTGVPYFARFQWMRRLCEKAGVRRFGIHAIRHLTASILAKSDVALIDIQAVLRHRNMATTERYIRRLTSLRPALKVLPGRATKSHQQEPPTKKGVSYY